MRFYFSGPFLVNCCFHSQPLATGDLFPDPIVWLFPGCYIHGIRWYVAFWVWFLSCSKIYQDPFMLLCGSAVIYTAVYLFTSWGTLGLLPEFSHCEKSHYKHSHTFFFFFFGVSICLHFSYLGVGLLGWMTNVCLTFIRNCWIIFQVAVPFCILRKV